MRDDDALDDTPTTHDGLMVAVSCTGEYSAPDTSHIAAHFIDCVM